MSLNIGGAAKSLLRNRLQASLTLIGMSVGVAMVVIVSGLGLDGPGLDSLCASRQR